MYRRKSNLKRLGWVIDMRATSTRTRLRLNEPKTTPPIFNPAFYGLMRVARNIWSGVREWCGDRAYDRYVQAQTSKSAQAPLLSPKEFYVEQLNRRYSRPNRCC
jgi:uncharacterized short protein YbdD (DUF466 family)